MDYILGGSMAGKKLTSERIQPADRIRHIREHMGYTQEAFANKLNISLSAYKKIESAENNISLNVLKKLNEMQVSSDYILFGKHKDVDEAWTNIQNCSEKDKMYLCIMLLLYFTDKNEDIHNNKKDVDGIFEILKKVIEEKGL